MLVQKIFFLAFLFLASCVSDIEQGHPEIATPSRPKDSVQPKVQEGIEGLVSRKVDDLSPCYQAEKNQNPSAKGRMLVSFMLDQEGRVGDPRIEYSSFQSPVFEGCVLQHVESWTFPKMRGNSPIKVRYPFSFGL